MFHLNVKWFCEKKKKKNMPYFNNHSTPDRQYSDTISAVHRVQPDVFLHASALCLHTTASIVEEWLFPLYGDHSISTEQFGESV